MNKIFKIFIAIKMRAFKRLIGKSVLVKTNPNLSFLVKNTNAPAGDKKFSDFKWPVFRTARFDQALTKFMYSFKNIYSENVNTDNACFLVGPTKSGKSWFLRYNLRKF